MSAKRKPVPAVPEPIRAFEIIDNLQPGQTLFQMEDGYHHPHIRAGEFAVVDLNNCEFQTGELYLVQWPGAGTRGIYQVTQRSFSSDGRDHPGIRFGPLNKPKFLPDGSLEEAQKLGFVLEYRLAEHCQKEPYEHLSSQMETRTAGG